MRDRQAAHGTILIVEDDPSQRLLLAHMLGLEGYDVAQAVDGVQALALLRDLDPDLVITDYEMPRMNGLELVRALREDPARAGLPVVMLTAHGTVASRLTSLEAGVDDYLGKPIARAEVCARVRNLLRLRRALRQVEDQNQELRAAMQAVKESHRRAMVAEKLACVGKLAMGLCHELNNPLAVVGTNVTVLGEYVESLFDLVPAERVNEEVTSMREDLPFLREESLAACRRLREVTDQFATIQAIDRDQERRVFAVEIAFDQALAQLSRRGRTEVSWTPPAESTLALGAVNEIAGCLTVLLGRVAALGDGERVTAVLAETGSPVKRATLVLSSKKSGPRIDAAMFFNAAHVANGGRVAYDFSLGFARDVLLKGGAEVEVDDLGGELRVILAFPAPEEAGGADAAAAQPVHAQARTGS